MQIDVKTFTGKLVENDRTLSDYNIL